MSQKEVRRLEGCGIKKMLPIFETKVLIYHSKVTLDFNLDLDLKLERYNPLEIYTGWVKKKFRRLEDCGIKSMWPILKTEMFIYQSTVNLDEKILFGRIPHLTDPEIRKMMVMGMFGNKSSTFHCGPWFTFYWNWNSASQTGNVNFNAT